MNFSLELLVVGVCLGFLFLLSLVEGAVMQSSSLALRMMEERSDEPLPPLLEQVLENKMEIIRPLHLGNQICLITIAILTTHLNIRTWATQGVLYSFITIFLMSLVFRQLLPQLLTQNDPEKKLIWLLRAFAPVYRVLRSLALPLSSVSRLTRRLHEEVEDGSKAEDEEPTGEEIQAYLEIGEDEGILQKEDSKLIQSVVEFGNTLVREVMTPRTNIVACEENATIAELRDVMVQHRHSRIPIFRGDMDHIAGIVYIRQLMAAYVKGKETDPISGLVNPVPFVPGTKPVSKLLSELQGSGDHAAIVIDEFGGVAGMVTIEDLIEEIIGEIRDEDQAKASEIIEEGAGSFVMHGSTELSRLEEVTGKKFDDLNCSTVAGLVMAYLGRVPAPGESFDVEDLRVQILDADRKRTHRIRIQLPEEPKDE
jgi:CBS domain containing-hemolysin-like protein